MTLGKDTDVTLVGRVTDEGPLLTHVVPVILSGEDPLSSEWKLSVETELLRTTGGTWKESKVPVDLMNVGEK